MLDIALVTDIAFWEIGNGQNARIRELFMFLAKHCKLTLYYLGDDACPFLSPSFQSGDKKTQLADYLERAKHDRIIVVKLYLDWVIDFAPKVSEIYLDAHDILSERDKTFREFHRHCESISFEQEMNRFSKFDKVILLQKDEAQKVLPWIGDNRVLLCPHPVIPKGQLSIRKKIKTIGFFGGPSQPNIDGIQWFHDAVLPLLGDLSQKCVVHGTINCSPFSMFSPQLSKGRLFPSVGSYYKQIDIAINPVLYGSGLKIKTVEALAYGIPLVTTSAGAQGLSEEKGRSYLLADTPQEFASSLCKLASSFTLRSQLSVSAKDYAMRYFTPHACFQSLIIPS